jgi:hypothetical protein
MSYIIFTHTFICYTGRHYPLLSTDNSKQHSAKASPDLYPSQLNKRSRLQAQRVRALDPLPQGHQPAQA